MSTSEAVINEGKLVQYDTPNNIYHKPKNAFVGTFVGSPNMNIGNASVKKDNPDLDLRMVFQSPYNKISKHSKTTYAKWCEKHDIPWCAYHSLPIEWLT